MAPALASCHDGYIMMSRTQISLEAELLERAKERSRRLGISLAEYVRRLLARDLGEPDAVAEARAIFALGRSDGRDVTREEDELLGEAAAAERRRDA